MAGNTAWISRIKRTVPAIAFRALRLVADTKIPAASEKNSVFASTNVMRQNSPIDTLPNKNGMASTGIMAIRP